MQLRRDIHLGLGLQGAAVVLLAFGSIALFARMAPTAGRILADNVSSLAAVEEMLALVAASPMGPPTDEETASFEEALRAAGRNISEETERAHVQAVAEHALGALSELDAPRRALIDALVALATINREAIAKSDTHVRRMGRAGAWSAVFLGFLAFMIAVIVVVRLHKRVLRPLGELHQVLLAAQRGDIGRRCHARQAPRELRVIASAVNDLLDERARSGPTGAQTASTDDAAAIRRVVLQLLDAQPHAMLVLDDDGTPWAASRDALERLQAEEGDTLRHALRQALTAPPVPPVSDVAKVDGTPYVLCTLS